MENKIIVYIIIAIGYYLYNRFQKLQEEANQRKVVIEKSISKNQTDRKKEIIESASNSKKNAREKTFDLSLPKTSYTNKNLQTQINPIAPQKDILKDNRLNLQTEPKIEFQTEVKETNDFGYLISEGLDLRKMVIYSEVLSKPAYLKY